MASTHTGNASLLSSTTNSAAGTTNSSSLDNTVGYGAIITALITNGGTGPTVGCSATLQVSIDNSTWKTWAQQSAGLTSSTAYSLAFEVPQAAMYARVQFTGNTGQSVTVEAQSQALTTI